MQLNLNNVIVDLADVQASLDTGDMKKRISNGSLYTVRELVQEIFNQCYSSTSLEIKIQIL